MLSREHHASFRDLQMFLSESTLKFLECFNIVEDKSFPPFFQVTFEVREVSLLGAKVNTSVGNNEGSVSTGGMLKNIFGRGEELSSEYSHGTKKSSSFFTTFTKPFHNEANTV